MCHPFFFFFSFWFCISRRDALLIPSGSYTMAFWVSRVTSGLSDESRFGKP